MGHDVEGSWIRSSVPSSYTEEEFIWVIRLFRCFDEDIPVSILIENSSVEKLILFVLSCSPSTFLDQIVIRKLLLRILVKKFHIGVLVQY